MFTFTSLILLSLFTTKNFAKAITNPKINSVDGKFPIIGIITISIGFVAIVAATTIVGCYIKTKMKSMQGHVINYEGRRPYPELVIGPAVQNDDIILSDEMIDSGW
ncbi:MAG: hypothetical protein EZS28_014397 [Streblomastix strix]|uniref:Uncharacterized protein n=1 Tax=Streblomastix strix TaxID=222440 RepID=A0A5J4W587_9EUKA|nr:MAG: hypothetical protein EZS28_014397 [Streblomastix strix]